jgi:hypothetical protein
MTTERNIDTSKNRYEVKDYTYPLDLFNSEKYGGNYMMIYINISTDSKLAKKAETKFIDGANDKAVNGELQNMNLSKKELNTVIPLINSTGGVLLRQLGLGGNKFSATGATLTTTGTLATTANAGDNLRKKKRLATAIALPMPNNLSISDKTKWEEEDTLTLQALGVLNRDFYRATTGNPINAQSMEKMVESLGDRSSIVANVALANGPLGKETSIATGLASNPKKEQLFKGVEFREFQLEYQFAPKTEKEARNVLNIIYQLRYHKAPEYKDPTAFLYSYPSEFDIVYCHRGKENPNLYKHTSCVLTDIVVDETPNNVFNTFEGGIPTQIKISLNFRELQVITKELIEIGY